MKGTPANQEIGVPRIGVPREGWRSRGYLPHFEGADVTQHVTFHLGDSLAQATIQRLEEELKFLPDEKRDLERRKRLDAWLDAGHGSCVLREPDIAEMVQGAILHFDTERYRMFAWVVMPNHVHVLFQPIDGWTVAKIVASWKKFTAGQISQHRRDLGDAAGDRVWHREYWDRYIRDQRHFDKTVEYIHQNPVKAGLVAAAEQWIWSSAWWGVGDRKGKGKGDCKPANQEIGVPRKGKTASTETGVPRKGKTASTETGVPKKKPANQDNGDSRDKVANQEIGVPRKGKTASTETGVPRKGKTAITETGGPGGT